MTENQRPPYAAAAIALLRVAHFTPRSLVGSSLDREEHEARVVVRWLQVVDVLRQNTLIP